MPGLSEFSAGFGLDEVTTKSGRRKAEAEEQQLDIGDLQLKIAKELYGDTDPLRVSGEASLGEFQNNGRLPAPFLEGIKRDAKTYGLDEFLAGGEVPVAVNLDPSTAYKRDVLEQQFTRARENTLNAAPAQGGRLASSLTDLEAARALGVTQIESEAQNQEQALREKLYGVGLDFEQKNAQEDLNLRKQLFASALGIGYGEAQAGLSGLAGASSTFGNVAALALQESLEKQKRAQEKAQFLGSFGAGAAGGGKKPSGGGGNDQSGVPYD